MVTRPILLVEDNPDDVELTRRAFKRSNVLNELHVATDGAEALNYLLGVDHHNEHKPLPAVILLDLMLPRVSGLKVLERIRAEERTRNVPVVILTSSNEQADLELSYKYGVNSFVRKPVDMEEFVRIVQQVGMYWLAVNEQISGSQAQEQTE